jgi:Tol biopolymer transport system component
MVRPTYSTSRELTLVGALLLAVCLLALATIQQSASTAFAGKNGKIAFYANGLHDDDAEIYMMNPRGARPEQLTNNTVQDYDPSWSSDGSRVAFWRLRANTNEIFVKNVTDGRLAKLTRSNDSWSDTSPSWSSNGEKIATVCDNLADGRREVCVMNADGSGRKRLTTNSLHEGMVVWSPDGSKIAFDTYTNENDIFVMNSDGTNPRNLTNTSEPLILERDPTWSPDGTRIAFDRYIWDTGETDIFVMGSDGSGKENITNTPLGTLVSAPTWSPDGREIAFLWFDQDSASDIWVMQSNGTRQLKVTDTSWGEWAPDWGPKPIAGG